MELFRRQLPMLHSAAKYTASQKKQDAKLLLITLTDFRFFTDGLGGKFATNSWLNIPPRLKHATALPCEI